MGKTWFETWFLLVQVSAVTVLYLWQVLRLIERTLRSEGLLLLKIYLRWLIYLFNCFCLNLFWLVNTASHLLLINFSQHHTFLSFLHDLSFQNFLELLKVFKTNPWFAPLFASALNVVTHSCAHLIIKLNQTMNVFNLSSDFSTSNRKVNKPK